MNCCLRIPEILPVGIKMKRKTTSNDGEFPEKRNRSASNGSCSPSSSQTQVCPGSIIAILNVSFANFE